jgi:hypothetical protein
MSFPEIVLEIRTDGGKHTLFLNGYGVTRPFANPGEVQAEFEVLAQFIDAARLEALKSVVETHGVIEPPTIRVVRDGRNARIPPVSSESHCKDALISN